MHAADSNVAAAATAAKHEGAGRRLRRIDGHRRARGVLMGAPDVAGVSRGTQRLGCGGTAGGSDGPGLVADLRAHGAPRSPLTCTFVELAGLEPAAFCLQTITP